MKASAPASSANLGPGFDSLALALELRCHVTVERSDQWSVQPADPTGFIEAAGRNLIDEPLAVTVASDIPIGKGLGSSAAVLAAIGLSIDRLLDRPLDRRRLFEIVAGREGHPDNAAATVYGGLVHAGPEGVQRLEIHPSWQPLLAVPEVELPTGEARQALPESVPFGIAARTASRAVRLVEALRTGDVELLSGIGPDELHEPHRIGLRPVIGELLTAARSAGAAFAAISGAGPSVIAFTTHEARTAVMEAMEAVPGTEVLRAGVAPDGVA